MQNHLTDKERRVIAETLGKFLGSAQNTEVILFGSMVNGKPRKTSDIDIAVKGPAPLDKSTWAKVEEAFDNSDLARTVDVVDYWRVTPEFQKVIDRGGQRLLATKSHPYRLCPTGFHWVSTHLRAIPPSLRNPSGGLAEVDGHCRINPKISGAGVSKELFTPDEVREIFARHGNKPHNLRKFDSPEKKNWNKLDGEIAFWTSFWNEIFGPKEPLDPNLVKALIASESSFNPTPRSPPAGSAGRARGLIQLTDQALKVLNGSKELKNYYFKISDKDLKDPNVSIASGIRWLFHKKALADSSLNRPSTWDEAILAYKGYLSQYKKNPKAKFGGMKNIKDEYDELANTSN